MVSLIISIVLQAIVMLFVFPLINDKFKVSGGFKEAMILVIVFIFMNFIIRKLIYIFTMGIGVLVYYLSLGLLGLLINALVLLLISKLAPDMLKVPSFTSALVGGTAIAIVNYIVK